jgi:Bacterial capsule synthesis protein PGA_cap
VGEAGIRPADLPSVDPRPTRRPTLERRTRSLGEQHPPRVPDSLASLLIAGHERILASARCGIKCRLSQDSRPRLAAVSNVAVACAAVSRSRRTTAGAIAVALALTTTPAVAAAQPASAREAPSSRTGARQTTPSPPAPGPRVGAAQGSPVPAPPPLTLRGPRVVATGVGFAVSGSGGLAQERLHIQIRLGSRWATLRSARADARGRFDRRVKPKRTRPRYLLRAVGADGRASPRIVVRSRDVTLAAVGDINLGDGPGAAIAVNGLGYPWTSVGPTLRAQDIAFGNLECSITTRGAPVPKQFTFRGWPAALRTATRAAGFDVYNLANNHAADYGTQALLDTVANVRRSGAKAVGAGGSLASASEARVVERLGLRVAFVGFSDILPAEFFAGPTRAGTQPATPELIRAGVRRARARADLVIATFHWGVERATTEDTRQRAFAAAALGAGATAVIGAHPHVLQPIRTSGRRLVAYSLGNFVFGAGSPGTTRTGILKLRLSARGVEGSRLLPAQIVSTRPLLLR